MRSKNKDLMDEILSFIGEYYRTEHVSPSTREIAAAIGTTNVTVYRYLVEMDKRGMLTYSDGVISRVDKMDKTETEFFSAPLVGSIACGDPENEEEQVVRYIDLPRAMFGKGDFYLLKATGDSMEDMGIYDGDIVLISRQKECRKGDVVVALDQDNENTLKRYGGVDRKSKKAILEYANEAQYPGERILVDRLEVQGVAKTVFHYL